MVKLNWYGHSTVFIRKKALKTMSLLVFILVHGLQMSWCLLCLKVDVTGVDTWGRLRCTENPHERFYRLAFSMFDGKLCYGPWLVKWPSFPNEMYRLLRLISSSWINFWWDSSIIPIVCACFSVAGAFWMPAVSASPMNRFAVKVELSSVMICCGTYALVEMIVWSALTMRAVSGFVIRMVHK